MLKSFLALRNSLRMVVVAALAVHLAFLALVIVNAMRPDTSPDVGSAPLSAILLWATVAYTVGAMVLIRFGMRNLHQLEALSLTDSLSGAPNRRALHVDFARNAATSAERAVALIDLDGFKAVNDHYGHFIGDRVLKECAAMLRDVCGNEATAYRLGGDEFAVVAIGPIAGNILEGICRKFLARLASPIMIDDRVITMGASVGLSRSTGDDGLGSSELLRRSDIAMYASKAGGRMRCAWYNSEFDRKREVSREIANELRQALQREELTLAYQPLVDAKTGQIVAVEGLLRWNRAVAPALGPDVFIPIAEETGLINPIGLWVLRKGCTDALAWSDITLSLNLSAAQLNNPEFPVQLGQILEETGFPPERLELEITETFLAGNHATIGRNLGMIRTFGVGVALDDFGTGYASIGFLRNFRFEKLKIDRALILDAERDDASRAMMVSCIAAARAMGMAVTAEGVETENQAALARIAGCDHIQGWLYYKALSSEEITRKLTIDIPEKLSEFS